VGLFIQVIVAMIRLPSWHHSDACELCDVAFGFLTLRHHCRLCGRSLCRSCCRARISLSFVKGKQMCCFECLENRQAMLENDVAEVPSSERMSASEMREWFLALSNYEAELVDPFNNELNRLVRRGVPQRFRATVWPALLR
jgi:hypothetical protein